MAWTAPRTWVTGETPTAAQFNAHVRDNLNFLYSPPSCRVYHNAAQAATTAVALTVALNSERFDNDTMHDTVTNNSRITFTTAGHYIVIGDIEFAANATGVRVVGISHSSAGILAETEYAEVSAAGVSVLNVSTMYAMSAADYVTIFAYQNSGGNLNVNSDTAFSPEFMAHWMGN